MGSSFESVFKAKASNGQVKTVRVVYDLTFYSEKKYKQDFDDFVAYQTGEERFEKDAQGRSEDGDLKFYRVKEYKFIPYLKFLDIIGKVFTRIVQQVFIEDPEIMVTDDEEFGVTFILKRVADRDWYFNTGIKEGLSPKQCAEFTKSRENTSPVENIDFVLAGIYLVHAIAFPAANSLKIPYSFVYRYLVHEFEGHKQHMRETYQFLERVRGRVKGKKFKRSSNYRVNYLFAAVSDLFDVGLGDFAALSNAQRVEIRMEALLDFRKDLRTLITIKGKSDAKEFWEKNFNYLTLVKGSFYCGKIMCFTIQLVLAKRRGIPLVAFFDGKPLPPASINAYMRKFPSFEIGNPGQESFKEAYGAIAGLKTYRSFIQLYELACKELGIAEEFMAISYALYDELKKEATRFYENFSREERTRMYEKIKSIN